MTRSLAMRAFPLLLGTVGLLLFAASTLVGPMAAGAETGAVVRESSMTLWVPNDDLDGAYVHVSMLLNDDGTGDFGTMLAGVRVDMMARFPGAVLLADSGVTAQFVHAGYKWTEKGTAYAYNSVSKPTGLKDDAAVVAAAAAEWNASGADWTFSGGAPSENGTGGCDARGRDHKNTIGWVDQTGQTLAVTCTWYTNATPGVATEFDMEIDPGWSWTTGSPVQTDLQSIVLHEFGHAIGLGHTGERCPGPVMCATYNVGRTIRQVSADDRAAIIALYGAAPTPSPTPTPSRTPTPTPTQIAIVRGGFRAVAQLLARD